MASCTTLTGSQKLARTAAKLFQEARYTTRMMQIGRPYICPFEVLVQHIPDNSSVLDIGCGSGLFLGLLAAEKNLARGLGVDVSRSSIVTARRMAAGLKSEGCKLSLEFEQGVLQDLYIPDRFDIVCAVDVMHHVPVADRRSLFITAVDKVRPGGMLLYKDISRAPRWRAWANQCHDLIISRQWVQLIAIGDIEQWAMESGLALDHTQYIPMVWYGHDLRIWSRKSG